MVAAAGVPGSVVADGRTDEDLLAAIARHEAAAFAMFHDRFQRRAFAIAFRILADRPATEDAVQDAMLAVWRHAPSYAPERGSAAGWLSAIVHHAALNYRRRSWQTGATVSLREDDEVVHDDAPDQQVVSRLEAARVRAALQALPPEQRQAIVWSFFDELSQHEIARQTGLPLGTVKGRVRLGLHKLQHSLADLAPETATSGAVRQHTTARGVAVRHPGPT